MSSYEPNKRHFRELLIYFFNLKKSPAEAHRLLEETIRGCVRVLRREIEGMYGSRPTLYINNARIMNSRII